jgi:hypothetical protein
MLYGLANVRDLELGWKWNCTIEASSTNRHYASKFSRFVEESKHVLSRFAVLGATLAIGFSVSI